MHDVIAFDGSEYRRRHPKVLLLQSLVGPFFHRIGLALKRNGVDVHKVNFNGGDKLFWGLCDGGIDYRGTEAEWPKFLRRTIHEGGFTDVLLFGDCRPVHRAAVLVCRDLNIPVHVFDEGYIRPDWVTFEHGGVNGYSQLPRDPAYYLAQAKMLGPLPPNAPVPFSFRRRSGEAILYDVANFLMRWRFPHWRNHRPWNPMQEGLGWLRRLSGRRAAILRSTAILAELEVKNTPYMLLPLQLCSDAQIRFHSPYENMRVAVEEVIKSFAAHAPPTLRLIIKEHPLDNGLSDWRALIATLAAAHNVADRVDYVEAGDIALIVRSALGLITVNSTTGTLALASGVPVITLGYAVYDMPGITHQDGLEAFWRSPSKPDKEIFVAFRCVLIDRCLVPGGFFSDVALNITVEGVVSRLLASYQSDFAFSAFDAVISAPYATDAVRLATVV
jgi:capsular polysaccharide export protein